MDKIKFSEIKNKDVSISDLSAMIIDRLETQVLFLPEKTSIIYQALNIFNFRDLKDTQSSIEKYSNKVLSVLWKRKRGHNDPIGVFMNVFLELSDSPYRERFRLEQEARKDLNVLDDLMRHYGSLDYIIRFKIKGDLPRNQEEKKLREFYLRAKKKYDEVIEYLLYKMDEIALKNMRPNSRGYDMPLSVKEYLDFPYREHVLIPKYRFGINMVNLDYRKINLQWNKKTNWSIKYYTEGQIGYSEGFLKMIKKKLKGDEYLKEISLQINSLPFLQDRREIIKELINLYKIKSWYGFYALAIPQAEGLFSRMLQIIEPNKAIGGALPNKVQLLRKHFEHSDLFFDYYEFHLPELRNRFSHHGHEEDIELQCKLILLDLHHIIEVFSTLEAPLIRLHNIVNNEFYSIEHVGNFRDLIELVISVKKLNQLDEIQDSVDTFILTKVLNQLNLELFISNLIIDFTDCLKIVEDWMEMGIQVINPKTEEYKIFSIEVKTFMKDKVTIIKGINKSIPLIYGDELRLLYDTRLFFHQFISFLPSDELNLIALIESVKKQFKNEFQIINKIQNVLKVEARDEYILKLKDFKHRIQ